MADIVISPNMKLPIPVVGVDLGPDWANNVNASLNAIDSHNHSADQGVPITPDGLNINSDLNMQGNDLTNTRSVRFVNNLVPLAALLDLGCIYEAGGELYYNDASGNQVQITLNGAVTGATGTITGLPSGTASASFAGGTFTFQKATSTAATMNVGPIVTQAGTAGSKTVTIAPSVSQPANYALTWPLAQGAANSLMANDGSGNLSFVAIGAALATAGIGTIVTASGSLTTTTSGNIASISLTAGTWLISAGYTVIGGSASVFRYFIEATATPGTSTYGINKFIQDGSIVSLSVPGYPVTLVGSTTYYITAATTSGASTDFEGSITALRVA